MNRNAWALLLAAMWLVGCNKTEQTTAPAAPAEPAQSSSAPTGGGKISDGVVKIAVLTDMSGLYSDVGGEGAVLAAKMAIEDAGGKVLDAPVELINADHQNKADIAANIARQWFDADKVDMIGELLNSAVGLAVQGIGKEKGKITINTGAASSRLTNADCSPTGVHWVYDTYALANITGKAVVKQGGDTWFFLTADYAFGHSLEKDTAETVIANGGKVLGSVRHPLSNSDFSSFLLQAQSSKAKIIGLANAGGDSINSIKQTKEFGIGKDGSQKLAGLLLFDTDIHSLGLETAQGLYMTTGFYWDLNDDTRTWAKRFFEKHKKMPTMLQAGVYSSFAHYLKAVKEAGTDEAGAVMAKMRAMPVNDFFAKGGKLREDGRMVHEMYLAQVKTPAEKKYDWDYLKIVETVPGDQAFKAMDKGECALVKKPS